jgi:hypothetical protein
VTYAPILGGRRHFYGPAAPRSRLGVRAHAEARGTAIQRVIEFFSDEVGMPLARERVSVGSGS